MVLLHTGGNQETIERERYSDEFSDFPKLCKLLYVHNITIYYINYIDEKPTRREVLTQLATISASWRSIGNGLGVNYNDLQGLGQANTSNQDRLGDVLQKWLNMNGQGEGASVTWKTILDVIKGPLVQNNALAWKIYEYLKRESSVQQSSKCVCNYFNYHFIIRGTSKL